MNTPKTHSFRIANMDCASEESEIRHALNDVAGIQRLQFNLVEKQLDISADDLALEKAIKAIRGAGFKPKEVLSSENNEDMDAAIPAGFWAGWGKLIAALLLAFVAEGLDFAWPGVLPAKITGMALAVTAIALSGFSIYGKGLHALRQGRLNISALMSVAVTGAFIIGQWPEAAMVMALYSVAEAIEARAVDRARGAIKSLMAMVPEDADVQQPDGSWRRVLSKDVALGTVVSASRRAIPTGWHREAGTWRGGSIARNGESIPVDKTIGDAIFAGTINQVGELEVQVTAPASDGTLARIIHAVEEAQSSRAPTQRFVDQFASYYTPACSSWH